MTTATQHLQYAKAVRKAHRRIKDILSSPTLAAALLVNAHDVQSFMAALITNAVYHENTAEYLTKQDTTEPA